MSLLPDADRILLGPGPSLTAPRVMRAMRGAALHMPGFISGETLRDAADLHHYFVLSMWRSRDDWERWAVTSERLALREKIAPMLTEPETLTILEHL